MVTKRLILPILILTIPGIISQKRILGGRPVELGEFPMMAQIYQYPEVAHICGGVILNHRTVLTAATCFETDFELKFNNRKVMVGDIDRNYREKSPISRQTIFIDELMLPEEYEQNRVDNNIAVVRLRWSIVFSTNVQSISLARTPAEIGTKCTVCGWGATEDDLSSKILMASSVVIHDSDDCQDTLKKFNPELMICAGDEQHMNGTCYGDKGGPLICKRRLAGLILYGRHLCYGMTAFVDVTQFSDWIIENSIIPEESKPGKISDGSQLILDFSFNLIYFNLVLILR